MMNIKKSDYKDILNQVESKNKEIKAKESKIKLLQQNNTKIKNDYEKKIKSTSNLNNHQKKGSYTDRSVNDKSPISPRQLTQYSSQREINQLKDLQLKFDKKNVEIQFKDQSITKNKLEIESLNSQINQLKKDLEIKKKQTNESSNKNSALKENLETINFLKVEIETLKSDKQSFEDRMRSKDELIEILNKQISDLKATRTPHIKPLEIKKAIADTTELNHLQENNKNLEKNLTETRIKLKKTDDRNKALTTENKRLQLSTNDYKIELENSKKTISENKNVTKKGSENVYIQTLNQKIKALSEEITLLKMTNSSAKEANDQLKLLTEKLEESKISQLKLTNIRLDEIKDLEERNTELLNELENTVTKAESNNEKQQVENFNQNIIETMQSEIANLEIENTNLKEELYKITKDFDGYKEKISENESYIKLSETLTSEIDLKNLILKEHEDTITRFVIDQENFRNDLNMKDVHMSGQVDKNQELIKQLENLKAQKNNLLKQEITNQLKEKDEENLQKNENISIEFKTQSENLVNTQKKELEEKSLRIDFQNSTIENLRNAEKTLSETVDNYKKQNSELMKTIELSKKSSKHTEKLESQAKKIEYLKTELNQNFMYLQLAQDKVKNLSSENDVLNQTNHEVNLKIEDVLNNNEDLSKANDKLESNLREIEAKIKDFYSKELNQLDKKNKKLTSDYEQSQQEILKLLEKFKEKQGQQESSNLDKKGMITKSDFLLKELQ